MYARRFPEKKNECNRPELHETKRLYNAVGQKSNHLESEERRLEVHRGNERCGDGLQSQMSNELNDICIDSKARSTVEIGLGLIFPF